jgi:two-component system KDP operon response regulator KdpE
MTAILVVEDDAALRSALVTSLQAHGYHTQEAASAEEAVVRADLDPPDLVLLDLSLPGADGQHALGRLRTFSEVPVVVLTARDGKADKIAALNGGADDYVTKPFDVDELMARLRAALRRRPGAATLPALVRFGELEFDRARGLVTRSGEAVHLTPTELRLLDILASSDGRLVTQRQLAAELAADGKALDHSAMRVYIGQLRKKLGDDAADPQFIVTHFGLGYRWIAGDKPP